MQIATCCWGFGRDNGSGGWGERDAEMRGGDCGERDVGRRELWGKGGGDCGERNEGKRGLWGKE